MCAKKNLKFVLIVLMIMLTACSSPTPDPPDPLPPTLPVAELPTIPPTPLPPTLDLTSVATVNPTPTPTTRPPTASPTPVTPFVAITSPNESADMVLGSDVLVRGLTEMGENTVISVTLTSLNGRLLAETQATIEDETWTATMAIPNLTSGDAFLAAVIQDESGSQVAAHQLPVNLVIDTNNADRYLALYHPMRSETAVGGFNLFFDGMVYRPTNSVISISVWIDDCQTRIARQSFTLDRSTLSFYWQGFLVVPNDVVGPACALAHFGDEGSEDYREAVMPIQILPSDDEQARGVVIANPPAGSHIMAGRELLLYGTALNTSEAPVSVSILMENGRIISQETAPADYWGYWEFSVTLPPDVFGPAKVTVTANEAEAEILINIDPLPTPEA